VIPTFGAQFKPFGRRLVRYFRAYGGWGAVFGSPLFVFSVLVTALSYSRWLKGHWASGSVSLLPSLLGFSLGTYAILFSLITARVKGAMRAIKDDRRVSALEQVNATFFHFIFVQVLALLWALASQGTALSDLAQWLSPRWPPAFTVFEVARIGGAAIGFLLLIYSVTLMIGAALAIYRLALIVDPGEQVPAPPSTPQNSLLERGDDRGGSNDPADPLHTHSETVPPAPRSVVQIHGQAGVEG